MNRTFANGLLAKIAAGVLAVSLFSALHGIAAFGHRRAELSDIAMFAMFALVITLLYGVAASYLADFMARSQYPRHIPFSLALHVGFGSLFFYIWLFPGANNPMLALEHNDQMFRFLVEGAFISHVFFLFVCLLDRSGAGAIERRALFYSGNFLIALAIYLLPYIDKQLNISVMAAGYIAWYLAMFAYNFALSALWKYKRAAKTAVLSICAYLSLFAVHQAVIARLDGVAITPREAVLQVGRAAAASLDGQYEFVPEESRLSTLKYSNVALLEFAKANGGITKADIEYLQGWIPETGFNYSVALKQADGAVSVHFHIAHPHRKMRYCFIREGTNVSDCSPLGIAAAMNPTN